MVVGAIGFYRRDLVLLFVALGLMGVHSTLFGPVKYAILPQHLRNDELVGGNGLVEMGTFVAILLGEIVGGPGDRDQARRTDLRRRDGDRDRHRRLPGFAPHSRDAGGRAGIADQLEPVHRDLAQPSLRARQPRRMAGDAGHLLVLVLWRDLPDAIRQLHQGCARRRRARRDLAARDFLDRHRGRLADVRAPVGTQGRDRTRPVRLDRPVGVRDRSVSGQPQPGAAGACRHRGVLRRRRALASHRRPDPDRHVRRLLHRPAVRADPGALGARVPLAHHRGQQYPQCDLHGRVGGNRAGACSRQGCRFRSCCWSPV